ncbi:hypothetical protein PG_0732 [Porphyromonas gingivalis W83]|uniref:Uncharacterized protein n=1 Tax=Porphyromonas gingivalis (strain ATCC BAA-308 / W83) TaxID=242619 RepID=Q7MWA0_PORGI|nr:hypothetical protein [Porphyromonas gingivalis]AAQ65901.1 hypothetical protein PG_0732 [Porphyromonas gingivalis W83]ATR91404.1 hypothetical protein CS544_10190 [Porphyromonas gingivalis]OWR79793.1 hypothetical protein SJDPG4_00595 [Porphyromonas gingivalis SJD4]USI94887.1 hypothetical protein MCS24_04705 [Porphyromonas gingivalis]USI96546.1 hypothetical protein MCS27_03300 [Porphyromonas gingivalis]
MHANGIFFVPKYSSKYGKKQQTEKQWPVPEMGWQPGAVNSNFALQSSALILIGGFIRIIKVDSNATSCIHFGGIDAKPLLLQMNAYSLPAAEIRTKNGRIVARVF